MQNTKKYNNILKLWQKISQDLLKFYGKETYNNWFNKIYNIEIISDKHILLLVESVFIKDWIQEHYIDNITYFIQKYNNTITNIDIIAKKKNKNNNIAITSITKTNKKIYPTLNSEFTFKNFIIDSSNEFAYSTAISIAKNKIHQLNILFVYGNTGTGKTHLIQSIIHYNKKQNKKYIIYISAENFMYCFIESLKQQNIFAFKKKFRSADLLIIEDIQFLSGKKITQEEFFYTLYTIINNNKIVIISCNCHPCNLHNINNKIISVLQSSILIKIEDSTYNLKYKILYSKLKKNNIYFTEEMLKYIVSNVSNIKEIKGIIAKIMLYHTLTNKTITLLEVQNICKDLIIFQHKIINITNIQQKVADTFNLKLSTLLSNNKKKLISKSRQIAMYIARTLTNMSLQEIAIAFHKKDHTTVIHAIKNIKNLILKDYDLKNKIHLLIQNIKNYE